MSPSTTDPPVEVRPAGPGSGWLVARQGSRVISRHRTQSEAAKEGKELAKRERVEFVLKGRDGQVRERSCFGSASPRRRES